MSFISRRKFLTTIGTTFGVAGMSFVLNKIGLINNAAYAKTRFQGNLPPTTGAGKSVAVLGAGVAGLRAAWELAAAGFEVKVIEGAPYMGGRSQTLRPASEKYKTNWLARQNGQFPESAYHTQLIQEHKNTKGNIIKTTVQTCEFQDDDWEAGNIVGNPDEIYLNAGPGRIASFHNALLDHCRKFDVALEPYIFASRQNLMQKDGFNADEPIRLGLIKHSLREEVAKILQQLETDGKLDEIIGKHDRQAFLDMVDAFGLEEPERVGFIRNGPPGGWFNHGKMRPHVSLTDVLDSEAWNYGLFTEMHVHWQVTMMQPSGGMDRVWTNMLVKPLPDEVGGGTIENLVLLNTPVTEVENVEVDGVNKVQVSWVSAQGSETQIFDFCISTMGPARLAPLVRNFSDPHLSRCLAAVSNDPACKVGWQSRGRWFESDYEIFGGISWTAHPITQMWYPSQDFHSRNATLTGLYHFGDVAQEFGEKSLSERLQIAAEGGAKLHNLQSQGQAVTVEDFKNEKVYFDRGLSVAWHQVPYQDGGWVGYDFETNEATIEIDGETVSLRDRLAAQPFDALYLAGDWISYTPGWQEGSIRTAMASVYAIAGLCVPADSESTAGDCRYENLPE